MFSSAVKILTVDGFDIKIDPSWLIIAALITWSLSTSFFPSVLPDAATAVYVVMAVLGMLGMFASLILHELAHSMVARRLGVPIKSITLFLFGGMAELGTEPKSARSEFLIAIAGPAMSFCLAAGFWMLAGLAGLLSSSGPPLELLTYLALVNLVLAVFNLIPAFPLDGGRVLRAALWYRSGDVLGATRTAAKSGALFAYGLMGLGLWALVQGAFVTGLWQLMIGAFVLAAARSSYSSQLANALFKDRTVDSIMTTDPITAGPDLTLSDLINRIMLRHGVSFVPVVDGPVLLGHIDQTVLSGIDRENWGSTRVGDVFVGLDANATIPPQMPVPDLFQRIARTGRRKFMIVSGHQLIGVITLADLTRFLNLGDLAGGE